MNKLDHLKILMSKNPFDIICLNETFCDDSIADNEISLPDYSIERKDRNRHGGGVAMYIRNNLTFVRRIDLEFKQMTLNVYGLRLNVNTGSLFL